MTVKRLGEIRRDHKLGRFGHLAVISELLAEVDQLRSALDDTRRSLYEIAYGGHIYTDDRGEWLRAHRIALDAHAKLDKLVLLPGDGPLR